MKGGGGEMVPFLTVYKSDEVIEMINLAEHDMLVMGRHHSCDIVVGHASSSRQHVEIQIIHATREILLTDLCSVHGTWLEGKRLTSMTPTLSKNAVTFQLGASRRVYRIEWLPPPAAEQSSGSGSELSSSAENAEESGLSGSRSATSGLRYTADSQDFLPSAPYASNVDNIFFPLEVNSSPTVTRPSTVKRSPAKPGLELRKSVSSPKIFYPQDENASPVVRNSPAKQPGQLTRSVSSPTKPMRRLAFSTLQAAATNTQSPRSPSVKKPLTERSNSSGTLKLRPSSSPKIPLTERSSSSGSLKPPSSPKIPSHKPPKAVPTTVLEARPSSKLWLRRCSSAPLPALATSNDPLRPQAPRLAALNEDQESKDGRAELSPKSSTIAESGDSEFPSDKENVAPKSVHSRVSLGNKGRAAESQGGALSRESGSVVESIVREPFRPLHYTTALDVRPVFHQLQDSGSNASSDDDYGSKVLGLPRPRRRSSSASQNLDLMLRRLKLSDSTEGRRQWHVVVDTNCLLDADSLKALKQLEGIREICVIIPKIVVRELDCLKHRHGIRSSARAALRWIESCMVKLPIWIHVQSSSETLPVRATPPVSPSMATFPYHGDLMSPTNDDHILECALIFAMTVHHGRVALLTKDTALKIKAMAEGLVSESAPEFCDSLLSPYSNRFLWAGSTAHGKTWVDRSESSSPASSYAGELRTSKSHIKHSLEDLRHHVNAQPRGLKLVVT